MNKTKIKSTYKWISLHQISLETISRSNALNDFLFSIKMNISKTQKINLTHKHSDFKNYVGLNFSSHLRICRSKGNTLVDPKKIKKGKYIILNSCFAHSIKGCRPLWWARGVLIPSPCVGGDSHAFSSWEDALFYFALPSRQRVGCDSWWLHWGIVRELSHSISVQCFIVTSLFMFPFPFYLLFYPCLYITFAMLLCGFVYQWHS